MEHPELSRQSSSDYLAVVESPANASTRWRAVMAFLLVFSVFCLVQWHRPSSFPELMGTVRSKAVSCPLLKYLRGKTLSVMCI